jgi:hypothetical protein
VGDTEGEFAELSPRRRIPRATAVLTILVVLAVTFGAGVLVQKHHDASLASSTTTFPNFSGGLPTSLSGGAFAGAGGGGTGSSSSSSGPVLIGTIVAISGNDVTVKDLGGATHVVHIAGSTSVTVTATVGSLKPGATVSVDGTKTSDGSINATGVTSK